MGDWETLKKNMLCMKNEGGKAIDKNSERRGVDAFHYPGYEGREKPKCIRRRFVI